jgi:hypothetical protein
MTPTELTALLSGVTRHIAGRALDAALEDELDRTFPPAGPAVAAVLDACRAAIAAGWMCQREAGEIDLVMPLSGPARFDGRGAGWVVYGPGSAHRPTVRGGKALVLYLLPGGAIDFTQEASP